MNDNYRICTRCIMDTSDPFIEFDDNGGCNHCRRYDEYSSLYGYREGKSEEELKALVAKIKEEGKGKEYDCILGISGGVDSAYLAHMAHSFGLRVLAVHVDAGWNSDIAVSNIQKLCDTLGYDLHTIVMDWPNMRKLQRAYMFSGLPNLDVPQDHAFLTNTYDFAKNYNIKYMLNGSNYNTECILPTAWGYDAMDAIAIKDVYKKCGDGTPLKKYPFTNLYKYYNNYFTIKRVNMLNYVNYTKKGAIKLLEKEYDWVYYGGKHFESRFTKFFQSYYLPEKFKYNKKRAHIASLVASGEMTRDQGLAEMEDDSAYTKQEMLEDRDYILKKLDISLEEWEEIMNGPLLTENDYKNNQNMRKFITTTVKIIKKFIKKNNK